MEPRTSSGTVPGAPDARVARLSDQLDRDPLGNWIADLIRDAYECRPHSWPAQSKGLQMLLTASRLGRGRAPIQSATLDIQEALTLRQGGQANAPRTAIRVHPTLSGLISAAQGVICTYGWFHEPTLAAFVSPDPGEAAEIEALLRRDHDRERGEDLLQCAKGLAEGPMAPSPGWRFSGPPPVLLVDQVLPGARWREVFVSPGCRGLQADQLRRVLMTAEVGVQVLAAAAAP